MSTEKVRAVAWLASYPLCCFCTTFDDSSPSFFSTFFIFSVFQPETFFNSWKSVRAHLCISPWYERHNEIHNSIAILPKKCLDLVLLVTWWLSVCLLYLQTSDIQRESQKGTVYFIYFFIIPYNPSSQTMFSIFCILFPVVVSTTFSTGFLMNLLTELIDHHMHRDFSDANTQTADSEAFRESLGRLL